jgi:hypothetical protein
MDARLESDRGIVVARVSAVSTTLRYRSEEELAAAESAGESPNRYHTSSGYHGKAPSYQLDLTDADLAEHGIVPGILRFPAVVDGPRPAAHAGPVATRAQHARAMDRLQNEGC